MSQVSSVRAHTQIDPRRSPIILFLVATSSFLATFNETFLNVALTPIMQTFTIDAATVQWVTTAYMLVAAVMVPITGYLFQRYNIKYLMIFALTMLILGSVVGALAPVFALLIVGRVMQAIGTGMLVPLGMNLTLIVAPRNKIGTYMGVVSAMTTLGPAFGPIVAGLIMAATDWHALFIVFAVIAILVLIYAAVTLTNCTAPHQAQLDIPSTIMASLGLIGSMYGISLLFGGNPTVGSIWLAAGIIFMILFIARQKTCAHPLLNLSPFSMGGFNLGVITVVLALMIVFSMNMILPVFMQSALGFSPLQAALTLLPPCLVSCVLAPIAGKIFDKYGLKYIAPLGMLLIALCTFGLSRSTAQTSSLGLIAWYAPTIVGCALVMGPSQSFALSQLTQKLYPHGTTIVGTSFQLAGCLGSSLFMGVYAMSLAGAQAGGADAISASVQGFHVACLVACGLGVCGLVTTGLLTRKEIAASKERALRIETSPAAQDAPAHDQRTSQDHTPAATPAFSGAVSAALVMNQLVHTVKSSQTAYEALQLMVENQTSGLPVLDDHGKLVGFVADGDILRALAREPKDKINMSYIYALWAQSGSLADKLKGLRDINIMELATPSVIAVDKTSSLDEICDVLSAQRIKKIPVTDGGKVVGVINRSALMRAMLNQETASTLSSI